MNQLVPITASYAPAVVAASGPRASYRFLEFFTSKIRNRHTRRAYARAAVEFFDWLAAKGVTQLVEVESIHVAGLYRAAAAGSIHADRRAAPGRAAPPVRLDGDWP